MTAPRMKAIQPAPRRRPRHAPQIGRVLQDSRDFALDDAARQRLTALAETLDDLEDRAERCETLLREVISWARLGGPDHGNPAYDLALADNQVELVDLLERTLAVLLGHDEELLVDDEDDET